MRRQREVHVNNFSGQNIEELQHPFSRVKFHVEIFSTKRDRSHDLIQFADSFIILKIKDNRREKWNPKQLELIRGNN